MNRGMEGTSAALGPLVGKAGDPMLRDWGAGGLEGDHYRTNDAHPTPGQEEVDKAYSRQLLTARAAGEHRRPKGRDKPKAAGAAVGVPAGST